MYQHRLKIDNAARVIVMLIAGGCTVLAGELRNSWVQVNGGKTEMLQQITLDDVIRLSKKKQDLSWDDFEKYQYKEGGSGLYIRCYEIEPQWKLFIGGGDLEEKPLYINLENSRTGGSFDIRENDLEFIVHT